MSEQLNPRLNPKLTKRALASSLPLGDSLETSSQASEGTTITSRSSGSIATTDSAASSSSTSSSSSSSGGNLVIPYTNPRIHLLHNGKWIPKRFEVGRHVPRTGMWTCCGDPEHFSLYCESLEQRDIFAGILANEAQQRVSEEKFRSFRKGQLKSHVEMLAAKIEDDERKARESKEAIEQDKKARGLWDEDKEREKERAELLKQQLANYDNITEKERDLIRDTRLFHQASSESNTFHAPILVSWLMKCFHEEPTMLQGLDYVLKHVQTGDGCVLLVKHGIVDALKRIHYQHLSHSVIQLKIITVFRQLLDCNFTRDELILVHGDLEEEANRAFAHLNPSSAANVNANNANNSIASGSVTQNGGGVGAAGAMVGMGGNTSVSSADTGTSSTTKKKVVEIPQEVVQICFTIAHRYMSSYEHIDQACKCLMQCSRSEYCRILLFQYQIIQYLLLFMKKFMSQARVLRSVLRLCNWATTTKERFDILFKGKVLTFALTCMKRHVRIPEVTGPAIILLRRAVVMLPEALEEVLRLNIPGTMIEAMKMLNGENDVQLEALKLLKTVSMTSEGWKQLENVRGGWQSITTGTLLGDALVHDLPGAFQNPGWSIGETPYLPMIERMKLEAAEEAKNSLQIAPKAAWTVHALREYMGLSMSGQTLAINTEYHEIYFELLKTLDLLPFPGEDKEDWFIRTRGFEKENDVSLEDMVATVQEMRRREAIQKKMNAQNLATTGGMDEVFGSIKEIYVNGKQVTTETLEKNDQDLTETLGY